VSWLPLHLLLLLFFFFYHLAVLLLVVLVVSFLGRGEVWMKLGISGSYPLLSYMRCDHEDGNLCWVILEEEGEQIHPLLVPGVDQMVE